MQFINSKLTFLTDLLFFGMTIKYFSREFKDWSIFEAQILNTKYSFTKHHILTFFYVVLGQDPQTKTFAKRFKNNYSEINAFIAHVSLRSLT